MSKRSKSENELAKLEMKSSSNQNASIPIICKNLSPLKEVSGQCFHVLEIIQNSSRSIFVVEVKIKENHSFLNIIEV